MTYIYTISIHSNNSNTKDLAAMITANSLT